MIIVAKFSSMCPRCGGSIKAGSQVEWSKGSKAMHAACATGAAPKRAAERHAERRTPSAPAKVEPPSMALAPYIRGEKWEPCKRVRLPDTTGEVRIAEKVKRGSWATPRIGTEGVPVQEGDAFVVVAQTARYESVEDNEDFGDMSGAGWQVTLYLRRATAEEAAPALEKAAAERAKREAAARRKALAKELVHLCQTTGLRGSDDDARRPQGRELELNPGSGGSGREIAVLSEDGAAVAVWHSGYYDDYRQSLAVTRDPRAVEIMIDLLGGAT
jgi:hypothetical protein